MAWAEKTIQKIVDRLVKGESVEDVRAFCLKSLRISSAKVDDAIKEARGKISVISNYGRDEEVGRSIKQLTELYDTSLKPGIDYDPKTALAARKELNKLMSLYPTKEERNLDETNVIESKIAKQLELIKDYVFPLKLTDPAYPIEEHIRIAVEKIIRYRLAKGDKAQ